MSTLNPNICTQCGAAVQVRIGLRGVCDFCGTEFLVQAQSTTPPPPPPNFNNQGTKQNRDNAQTLVQNGIAFMKQGDFNSAKRPFAQAVRLAPNWFLPLVWLAKAITNGFIDFTNIKHAEYMQKARGLVDANSHAEFEQTAREYNQARQDFVNKNAPIFRQKANEYNEHDAKYTPLLKKWLPTLSAAKVLTYISFGGIGYIILGIILRLYLSSAIIGFVAGAFLIFGIVIRCVYNAKINGTVQRVAAESEEMVQALIRMHRAISFIDPSIIADVVVYDYKKPIDLRTKYHHVKDEDVFLGLGNGSNNSFFGNLGNSINNMVNSITANISNIDITTLNLDDLDLDDDDDDDDF